MYNSMDESVMHYAKLRNPILKCYILHTFSYLTFGKGSKQEDRTSQWFPGNTNEIHEIIL